MKNKCQDCGNQNAADASFCESCGVKVVNRASAATEVKTPRAPRVSKLPSRKTWILSGTALGVLALTFGLIVLNPFAPKEIPISIKVVDTAVAGFKLSASISVSAKEFDPKKMTVILQLKSTNSQNWETLGMASSSNSEIKFLVPEQTSITIRGAVENESSEFIGFSKELNLKTFDLESALVQLHQDEAYAFQNGTSTGFDFWANHVDAADVNPNSARWQEDYQQSSWTDELGYENSPFVEKKPILSSLKQIPVSQSDMRQWHVCPNLQAEAKPGAYYQYDSNDVYNYMRVDTPYPDFRQVNYNLIKLSGTKIYMYPVVCQPYGHD